MAEVKTPKKLCIIAGTTVGDNLGLILGVAIGAGALFITGIIILVCWLWSGRRYPPSIARPPGPANRILFRRPLPWMGPYGRNQAPGRTPGLFRYGPAQVRPSSFVYDRPPVAGIRFVRPARRAVLNPFHRRPGGFGGPYRA